MALILLIMLIAIIIGIFKAKKAKKNKSDIIMISIAIGMLVALVVTLTSNAILTTTFLPFDKCEVGSYQIALSDTVHNQFVINTSNGLQIVDINKNVCHMNINSKNDLHIVRYHKTYIEKWKYWLCTAEPSDDDDIYEIFLK